MKTTTISTAEQFIIEHASLNSKIQRRIDSALSVHGLSFTEYLILNSLSKSANLSLRRIDLAESIGVTASGVTRILAPMEKIKLVEKEQSARDARVSLVKLTNVGAQIFSDASVSFSFSAEGLCKPLDEAQLHSLLQSTQKLLN